MSTKTQINPSHVGVGNLPIPSPTSPIAFPPALPTVPAASGVHLFFFELPTLFGKLATLGVPVSGETPEQQASRYNTLYLAQMCALKGFFDPPAPLLVHPIEPDPVHPVPLVGGVIPRPEPGNPPIRPLPPIVPTDPVVGGEPFAALLHYVQSAGNLNGVASLFLTLWNDAGLRKDSAQTVQATQVWQKAVTASPASDVPEVLFYDHAVKQMFRLPGSILTTLSENAAVNGRWAKGETFRKELGTLATKTYMAPFTAPTVPVGGQMSPMAEMVMDWFKEWFVILAAVGSCGVMIDGTRKACWFSGICYVAPEAANLATGTSVSSDFFAHPDESRYAPYVAMGLPHDTPIEITAGSILYIFGPDPNQSASEFSEGPIGDEGNNPGPPEQVASGSGPEEDGSQGGEGGTAAKPGYVRRHRPAEPRPVAD